MVSSVWASQHDEKQCGLNQSNSRDLLQPLEVSQDNHAHLIEIDALTVINIIS